jgi:hypothetical protein
MIYTCIGTLPSALDTASLFLPRGNKLLQMKTIASTNSITAHIVEKSRSPRGSFIKKYLMRKLEDFKYKREGTEVYYRYMYLYAYIYEYM